MMNDDINVMFTKRILSVSFPHHMNVCAHDDPKFSTVSFPHHMNVGTHDDQKFSTVGFPHHMNVGTHNDLKFSTPHRMSVDETQNVK